jgi:serine/threonine protein kinase
MNRAPPDEGKRTTIRGSPSPAARPGSVTRSATFGHTLPEGSRLGEFEILGLIGEGGFGIVYLAMDHSLQRRVALKEYMPSSLAARISGEPTVAVKSQEHADAFHAGMTSFINEARLLAQFDHPALVKVYLFWQANGTAYMVMPFYEGPTLQHALQQLGHPPDETWLRQLLDPLLDALNVLHSARCLHRDIAPDNILLTETGPLLLDFGAARRVIGDATHALTAILKVGYAPVEQYGQVESMRQGPWTDIYALACVVYFAISGKAPLASIERLLADRMEPLSALAAGRYSPAFLRAIDAGLAVSPEARPRDITEFRGLLAGVQAPAAPPRPATTPGRRQLTPAPGVATVESRRPASVPRTAQRPTERSIEPLKSRRLPTATWYAAATVIVLMIGGAAWWLVSQRAPPARIATPATPVATDGVAAESDAPPPVAEATPEPAASKAAVTEPPGPGAEESAAHSPEADRGTGVTPTAEANRDSRLAAPSARTTQPAGGARSPHDARASRLAQFDRDASRPTSRCNDLLQKASLESLTSEELQFWKKECT